MKEELKLSIELGITLFLVLLGFFFFLQFITEQNQKELCNRYSTEYNIQTEIKDTGWLNYGKLCYIKTDKGDIRASDFSIADIATPLRR